MSNLHKGTKTALRQNWTKAHFFTEILLHKRMCFTSRRFCTEILLHKGSFSHEFFFISYLLCTFYFYCHCYLKFFPRSVALFYFIFLLIYHLGFFFLFFTFGQKWPFVQNWPSVENWPKVLNCLRASLTCSYLMKLI